MQNFFENFADIEYRLPFGEEFGYDTVEVGVGIEGPEDVADIDAHAFVVLGDAIHVA